MKRFPLLLSLLILSLGTLFSAQVLVLGNATKDEVLILKEWRQNYDAYRVDATALSTLKSLPAGVEAEVYFGSWCGDSKLNVPKLVKIFETVDKVAVKYIGVNRRNDEKSSLFKTKQLERIPTVVLLYQGKEVGRIVENPKETLEKDLVSILTPILR